MESNRLKKYQKDYYKGLFDLNDPFLVNLKFFLSSYVLQKEKHNKTIDPDLFVESLKRTTIRLRRNLSVFSILLKSYRDGLQILADIFEICHFEVIEMLETENVNRESVDKLIKEYYFKKEKQRNPFYSTNAQFTQVIDQHEECRKFALDLYERAKPSFARFGAYLIKSGLIKDGGKNSINMQNYCTYVGINFTETNLNLIGNPTYINARLPQSEKLEVLKNLMDDLQNFHSFFIENGIKKAAIEVNEDILKLKKNYNI